MPKKPRKKSLKETNPYLRDPKKYEESLVMNVITSSAVEGVNITPDQLQKKGVKSNRT